MKTLTIAEVKANFSGLARQVEQGTTVLVTRHGKIILEIRPVQRRTPEEAAAEIRAFRGKPGFDREAPLLRPGETPREYVHRGHRR